MQEEKFSLGSIKIHKTVIAQIASEAICEIEGVVRLASDFRADIGKLFGKRDTSGIKVDIDNNEVALDVFVIVEYGANIPKIASKIQDNVKAAIEKTTDLTLLDINVNIQGVERGK